MRTEQDKPVDDSVKAKTLIEEFMSAEQGTVSGNGRSEDEREKEERRLRRVKREVSQVVTRLGNKGFSVFSGELGKLEQKAHEQYNSSVSEYCIAGQTNPNLGDFYDNESSASFIALRRELDSLGSVRSFLRQIADPSGNTPNK